MSYQLEDLEPSAAQGSPVKKHLDAELLLAIQAAANDAALNASQAAVTATRHMISQAVADVENKLSAIETPKSKIMAIRLNAGETRKLQSQACACLPDMIINASLGINTMLVGPAGCGKTFAAHQLAEALGLPFGHVCLTAGASETWLFGRQTPTGFIEGTFSKLYRLGGVFLADEMDAADANMLLSINTALANGSLFNPISGETYQKHEKFVFVGACNTFGKGGDHVYTGRSRLDAATLDRFELIPVDYDAEIEKQLCPDLEIYSALRHARAELARLKSREIISSRAFDRCYKKHVAGQDMLTVFKRMTLSWPESLADQCGLTKFSASAKPKHKNPAMEAAVEALDAASVPTETAEDKIKANNDKMAAIRAKLEAMKKS